MYRLHYAPDNASLIVRLALEHVGARYDTALVDRRTHAQRSEHYLAISPNGLIPALETPDGVVFETAAILLWLSERHAGLMPPADSPDRAKALTWLVYTANTLHVHLRMVFYTQTYTDGPTAPVLARAQGSLIACYDTLNVHLPDTPGFAQTAYLAACMRWSALYGPAPRDWFDAARWPRLAAMAARLEQSAAARTVARAEGLGAHPFTRPEPPNPPEGSAI